jgi:hypothetical protein
MVQIVDLALIEGLVNHDIDITAAIGIRPFNDAVFDVQLSSGRIHDFLRVFHGEYISRKILLAEAVQRKGCTIAASTAPSRNATRATCSMNFTHHFSFKWFLQTGYAWISASVTAPFKW